MNNTVRPPSSVSMAQLFLSGFLSEDDVTPSGVVLSDSRVRAEREHAEFLSRAQTARPSTTPSTLPSTRTTHLPTPRSHPSTPRTPSTTSHVSRIRQRQTAIGKESTPERLVLDTCCICLNHPKEYAIVPCYHLCICKHCAKRVRACPLCRRDLNRVQKIFF